MKVFSFFTSDLYRENAEGMKQSAEMVGLDCELLERPDLGSWWQNVNQKCQVILEMIRKYPDEQLVWTDADARYVQYPKLFQTLTDYDLALYMMTKDAPHSGVMLLNGAKALRYVEAWVKNVAAHPRDEDDSNNLKAALQGIPDRNIYHLPPAYIWHERNMRHRFPGSKPVIIHTTVGNHDYPGGS